MCTKILQTTHLNCSLMEQQINDYSEVIQQLHNKLETTDDLNGWLHYPEDDHDDLISQIEQVAAEIRQEADVLIVVGVGGIPRGSCDFRYLNTLFWTPNAGD